MKTATRELIEPAADHKKIDHPHLAMIDDLVLVLVEVKDKSDGGIIIPDAVSKAKQTRGTVISAGPGKWNEYSATRNPMQVKQGDVVVFGPYEGVVYEHNRVDYKILRESEIRAVVKG